MKSVRARIVLASALAATALAQTACSGGRSTAEPQAAADERPCRGLVAQADPIARNVLIQMNDPALVSVSAAE